MWMIVTFGMNLWKRIQRDDVLGLAAQLAYFFLLSLFPLLIFVVTLLPYLPITQENVLSVIRDFAPEQTMELIEMNLNEVMSKQNGKLLSVGIIATLWVGSNGFNAIVRAFNKAYDVKETRSFLIARGMALVFTIALIIVFIIALLLPLFGELIGLYLFSRLGLSDEFLTTWNAMRWLLSPFIIFVILSTLYWLAPNKKLTTISVLPGAIFSTIGWTLMSLVFSFYVNNFGNYSATYGSIGAIIVLLIWLYLSGIIIMIGGEINAMYSNCKKVKA